MAKKDRLIGNDGAIYLLEEETEFVGDDTKTLDEHAAGLVASGDGKGFYQVTKIADSGSVFAWSGAMVGDYFYNDGKLKPIVGDACLPVALLNKVTEDTSIKGFEVALTKDKIDVTTIPDKVKTYRMGKTDANGTLNGITSVSNDMIRSRFLDNMKVSSAGAFTMTRKTDKPMLFVGFLNADEIAGDTLIAVVGRIEVENVSLGATDGSAQEFSSGFAASSGDKLQLITIDIASS